MSESMSKPWIRDYLIEIAETHGACLYNVQASTKKKKVQLTDLLTYQENSYVWAWISDKKHRISARISRDAVDKYKKDYGRSIFDSRFFLIFVSNYRPMFSPRPLGPNASGNTAVSHLSLEIDHVSSIGAGSHLFGDPHELESEVDMKEWVLGLRQDGGGGNVLKLRKQQEQVQNKEAPPSPPATLPLVSHDRAAKVAKDVARPNLERPQDAKRVYSKRWRRIELDPWKLATKPAVEKQSTQTEPGPASMGPLLDNPSRFKPTPNEPVVCPTTPRRSPSSTCLQQQATPTDWSLSISGSPIALNNAGSPALENGVPERDGPQVSLTTSLLPSDTGRHATVNSVVTSDTCSLQPPTPAQRIRRSPIRHSSPPRSPPRPSQQLPGSSPPPLSSSLPIPSSSLSIPMGIRKNIQRKVPHPEPPLDPTKRGPIQVLVPNSDASGTGSSQSHMQSLHLSQSQQQRSHLLSHPSDFPSSQSQPPDASTPREEQPINASRRMSKMYARSSPIKSDGDEQESTSARDKPVGEVDVDTGKQRLKPDLPSASKMEVVEGGNSDISETDGLQMTHRTARKAEFNTRAGAQEASTVRVDAGHGSDRLSVGKAKAHSSPRSTPASQPPLLASASVTHHLSLDTGEITSKLFEQSGARSPMHSLFSGSLADERRATLQTPVSRAEDRIEERAGPSHISGHDPETWKMPSFMRSKGKEKEKAPTVKGPDIPSAKVGEKRRRSVEPVPPRHKRAKTRASEAQTTSSSTTSHEEPQNTRAIAAPNVHSNNKGSSSRADTAEATTDLRRPRPRLASFVVDFERAISGKRVPAPRLDLEKDMKGILLRTGRIRTLGKKVESDGSVYIMKR